MEEGPISHTSQGAEKLWNTRHNQTQGIEDLEEFLFQVKNRLAYISLGVGNKMDIVKSANEALALFPPTNPQTEKEN